MNLLSSAFAAPWWRRKQQLIGHWRCSCHPCSLLWQSCGFSLVHAGDNQRPLSAAVCIGVKSFHVAPVYPQQLSDMKCLLWHANFKSTGKLFFVHLYNLHLNDIIILIMTWIPYKLVIPSHLISWKTTFLILAGTAIIFFHPNHIWQNALPANTRNLEN